MASFAVLGDEETVVGFGLVGIRQGVVFNESTVKEDVAKLEAEILIVTETVAEYLRNNDITLPMTLAEVPDKTGPKGYALAEISKLFKSAVGIELKEE